ncbi:hypothetical protein MJO28_000246 [Puccinia striiformis f. sp. tritici]|uniref:Uncharacterized protein n=1 Tax=Puccinia striiformis f. sp. tritici TaxID=168172 RepID=A0ACC0EXE6_9BASI|nr:hypothetical protein MJO28_000246 [Puccinia striiformis f. sp. tritici]KAI7967707.1 hypothetical protein MJO29_000984 [Puccinia striiformis f. sp. tritici]
MTLFRSPKPSSLAMTEVGSNQSIVEKTNNVHPKMNAVEDASLRALLAGCYMASRGEDIVTHQRPTKAVSCEIWGFPFRLIDSIICNLSVYTALRSDEV